jgi:hypothetical protein
MTCPHCSKPLTEAQIKRIWASYTGSKQTPHAGPGRPPKGSRCPCGAMTRDRAAKRGHKCGRRLEAIEDI